MNLFYRLFFIVLFIFSIGSIAEANVLLEFQALKNFRDNSGSQYLINNWVNQNYPNWEGVTTNSQGRVLELKLENVQIQLKEDLSQLDLKALTMLNFFSIKNNSSVTDIPILPDDLKTISIDGCSLSELDLSTYNSLQTLNFTNNSGLISNGLKLPISPSDLEVISLNGSSIESLNLIGADNLRFINISDNPLLNENTLTLPGNISNLTSLFATSCSFTTLNLSASVDLKDLYLSNNVSLSTLTLPANLSKLEYLYLTETNLTSLNLLTADNLVNLYINDNSNLDNQNFTFPSTMADLQILDASNCNFSQIYLPTANKLERLEVEGNSNLDLLLPFNLFYLEYLNAKNCSLEVIDLSGAVNLKTLLLNYNNLTFESLEPNSIDWYYPSGSYGYSNQSNPFGAPSTHLLEPGGSINLSFDFGGSNTSYQWEKLIDGSWETLSGEQSFTLSISNFNENQKGDYRLTAVNSVVNGLTLFTATYTLDLIVNCELEVNTLSGEIADDGFTSLREAIECANSLPGKDEVYFNLDESLANSEGVFVIETNLPNISNSILINGIDGEVPRVHIKSKDGLSGFNLDAENNTNDFTEHSEVNDVIISGFSHNFYINEVDNVTIDNVDAYGAINYDFYSSSSDGVIVKSSFIGTDGQNNLAAGIYIHDGENIQVGGDDLEDENIIVGYTRFLDVSNSTIRGNKFGIQKDGETLISNYNLGSNLMIENSNSVIIGGDGVALNSFAPKFTVSFIGSHSNTLAGNNFGVTDSGEQFHPEEYSSIVSVINLDANSYSNLLGIEGSTSIVNQFVAGDYPAIKVGGAPDNNFNSFYGNIINRIDKDSHKAIDITCRSEDDCSNQNIPTPTGLGRVRSTVDGYFYHQYHDENVPLQRIELFASNEFGTSATQFLGWAELGSGVSANAQVINFLDENGEEAPRNHYNWSVSNVPPDYDGWVVATATDANGNTSELSEAFYVYARNLPPYVVNPPLNNTIYLPVQTNDPAMDVVINWWDFSNGDIEAPIDYQTIKFETNDPVITSLTGGVCDANILTYLNVGDVDYLGAVPTEYATTTIGANNFPNTYAGCQYDVEWTATDNGDTPLSTTEVFRVELVKFDWFYSGCDGLDVHFTAYDSDPNAQYEWSFDNGGSYSPISTSPTYTHTFPDLEDHTVTLRVTHGATVDTYTRTVHMINPEKTLAGTDKVLNEWVRKLYKVETRKNHDVIEFDFNNGAPGDSIKVANDYYFNPTRPLVSFLEDDANRKFTPDFEFDLPHIKDAEGTWCINSVSEGKISTDVYIDYGVFDMDEGEPEAYLQYVVIMDKERCTSCPEVTFTDSLYSIYPVQFEQLPSGKRFFARIPIRPGQQYLTIGKLSEWNDFQLTGDGGRIDENDRISEPGIQSQFAIQHDLKALYDFYWNFADENSINVAKDMREEFHTKFFYKMAGFDGSWREDLWDLHKSYYTAPLLAYRGNMAAAYTIAKGLQERVDVKGNLNTDLPASRVMHRGYLYFEGDNFKKPLSVIGDFRYTSKSISEGNYTWNNSPEAPDVINVFNTDNAPAPFVQSASKLNNGFGWYNTDWVNAPYHGYLPFDGKYPMMFSAATIETPSDAFEFGTQPLGESSQYHPVSQYLKNKDFRYPIETLSKFARYSSQSPWITVGNQMNEIGYPWAPEEVALTLHVGDIDTAMAEGDYIRMGFYGGENYTFDTQVTGKPYSRIGRTWFLQVATTHNIGETTWNQIMADFQFTGPLDTDQGQYVLLISQNDNFDESLAFGLDKELNTYGVALNQLFTEGSNTVQGDSDPINYDVPTQGATYFVTIAKMDTECDGVNPLTTSAAIGFTASKGFNDINAGILNLKHNFEGYDNFDQNEYMTFDQIGSGFTTSVSLTLADNTDGENLVNMTPTEGKWCISSIFSDTRSVKFSIHPDDFDGIWDETSDNRHPALILTEAGNTAYVAESGFTFNEETGMYESAVMDVTGGQTLVFAFIHTFPLGGSYNDASTVAGIGMAAANYEGTLAVSDQLSIAKARKAHENGGQNYLLVANDGGTWNHPSLAVLQEADGVQDITGATKSWKVHTYGDPGQVDVAVNMDGIGVLPSDHKFFLAVNNSVYYPLNKAEGSWYQFSDIALSAGDILTVKYGFQTIIEAREEGCILTDFSGSTSCELILRDISSDQQDIITDCMEEVKSLRVHVKADFGDHYNLGATAFSQDITVNIVGKDRSNGSVVLYTPASITLNQNQDAPEQVYVFDVTTAFLDTEADLSKVDISATSTSPHADTRLVTSFELVKSVRVAKTETPVITLNDPVALNGGRLYHFSWDPGSCSAPGYELQLLRLYNEDENITSLSTTEGDVAIYPFIDWDRALTIHLDNYQTSVDLTIAEGTGFYTWRVRPVGDYFDEGSADNNGTWTTHLRGNRPYPIMVGDDVGNNSLFYFTDPVAEEDMNYSYARTFTEGGRIKESATYANSLQQVKQTQTRLPSNINNQVIVSQTVYDHAGRPAVQSLPVPVNESELGYVDGVLQSSDGQNTSIFRDNDFDDDANYQNINLESDVAEGLALDYYDNSTDAQIPSSEGFPYTRTQFFNDGTGAVQQSGSPGAQLSVGQAHNVRVGYSMATDDELIRVFGADAPSGTSVLKKTTLDPNNVASVEYISKEGKTIATSLTESHPDLPKYQDAVETELFTPNQPFHNVKEDDYTLFAEQTVHSEIPFDLDLNLDVTPANILAACEQYCVSCRYQVNVQIYRHPLPDEENGQITLVKEVTKIVNPQDVDPLIKNWKAKADPQDEVATCETPTPEPIASWSFNQGSPDNKLNSGTYHIMKYVRIDDSDALEFAEEIAKDMTTDFNLKFAALQNTLEDVMAETTSSWDIVTQLNNLRTGEDISAPNGYTFMMVNADVEDSLLSVVPNTTDIADLDGGNYLITIASNSNCCSVEFPLVMPEKSPCEESSVSLKSQAIWADAIAIIGGDAITDITALESQDQTQIGFREPIGNYVPTTASISYSTPEVESMLANTLTDLNDCQRLWDCSQDAANRINTKLAAAIDLNDPEAIDVKANLESKLKEALEKMGLGNMNASSFDFNTPVYYVETLLECTGTDYQKGLNPDIPADLNSIKFNPYTIAPIKTDTDANNDQKYIDALKSMCHVDATNFIGFNSDDYDHRDTIIDFSQSSYDPCVTGSCTFSRSNGAITNDGNAYSWEPKMYKMFLQHAKVMLRSQVLNDPTVSANDVVNAIANDQQDLCREKCKKTYESFKDELYELFDIDPTESYVWQSNELDGQGAPTAMGLNDICCTAQSMVESCESECLLSEVDLGCGTGAIRRGTEKELHRMAKILGGTFELDKPTLTATNYEVYSPEVQAIVSLLKDYYYYVVERGTAVASANGYYDFSDWAAFYNYNAVWRNANLTNDDYIKYVLIDNNGNLLLRTAAELNAPVTLDFATGAGLDTEELKKYQKAIERDGYIGNNIGLRFELLYEHKVDGNGDLLEDHIVELEGVTLLSNYYTATSTLVRQDDDQDNLFIKEGFVMYGDAQQENPNSCACDLAAYETEEHDDYAPHVSYSVKFERYLDQQLVGGTADDTPGNRQFTDIISRYARMIESPDAGNGYYVVSNSIGDPVVFTGHYDENFDYTGGVVFGRTGAKTGNPSVSLHGDALTVIANVTDGAYRPDWRQMNVGVDGAILPATVTAPKQLDNDPGIFHTTSFNSNGETHVWTAHNKPADDTHRTAPRIADGNIHDIVFSKLDQNGDLLEDYAYNTNFGVEEESGRTIETIMHSVVQTTDGNYVVMGSTNANKGGFKSDDKKCQEEDDADYFAMKVQASTGLVLWNNTYGMTDCNAAEIDEAYPVGIELSNGNILMRGTQYNEYKYVLIDGESGDEIFRHDEPYDAQNFAIENFNRYSFPVKEVEMEGEKVLMFFGKVSNLTNVYRFQYFDLDMTYKGEKNIQFVPSDPTTEYDLFEFTKNGDVLLFGRTSNETGTVAYIEKHYSCDPQHVGIRWSYPKHTGNITADADYQDYAAREAEKAKFIQGEIDASLEACELDIREILRKEYKNKCLTDYSETGGVTTLQQAGHYTLYYYDRAGNLTQTVPPEGVKEKGVDRSDTILHNLRTTYNYNSLGQLISQTVPDHEDAVGNPNGETQFIYNYNGLLRFSQNPQQASEGVYSYTKYDALGRIIEVGEASDNTSPTFKPFNLLTASESNEYGGTSYPKVADANLSELTITEYNTPSSGIESVKTYDLQLKTYNLSEQSYLANRISHTYTDQDGDLSSTGDQVHTYYSYDPHGNVSWLLQRQPKLDDKVMVYHYDLISGNVLQVDYQPGYQDQFYHRYTYDADNRIEQVETSRDGVIWDKDANYDYYAHGPLKRSVIGEDKVQGIDYTYTINGWLKAINHPVVEAQVGATETITAQLDPGHDGYVSAGSNVARDAFGMELHYFGGDFRNSNSPFDRQATVAVNGQQVALNPFGSSLDTLPLYNGNIAYASFMSQYDANVTNNDMLLQAYRYDYLNRLKKATSNNLSTSSWTDLGGLNSDYTYDGNGNIEQLNRWSLTEQLDQLNYEPIAKTNKLKRVTDGITAPHAGINDLVTQTEAVNYQYDKIGNLTKDKQEDIDEIKWTVYGKVASILKDNGDKVLFSYDATGNRIAKEDIDVSSGDTVRTHYILDASGNQMAVYKYHSSNATLTLEEQALYGSDRVGVAYNGEEQFVDAPNVDATEAIIDFDSESYYFAEDVTGSPYGKAYNLGAASNSPYQYTFYDMAFVKVKPGDRIRVSLDAYTDEPMANFSTPSEIVVSGLGYVPAPTNRNKDKQLWYKDVEWETGVWKHNEIVVGPFTNQDVTYARFFINTKSGLDHYIDNIHIDVLSEDDVKYSDEYYKEDFEDYNGIGVVSTEQAYSGTQSLKYEAGSQVDMDQIWVKVKAGDMIMTKAKLLFTQNIENTRINIRMNLWDSNRTEIISSYLNNATWYYGDEGEWGTLYNTQVFQTDGDVMIRVDAYGGHNEDVYMDDLEIKVIRANNIVSQESGHFTRDLTQKHYELKDHLGNVRATVSDRKLVNDADVTLSYMTDLKSKQDYYPFGWTMPGRKFTGVKYRYGFNGAEKTDEFHNSEGTVYDYGFRIYDSRISRFMSVDPLTASFPWYTPYQFAGNKPIKFIDIDGLEEGEFEIHNEESKLATLTWRKVYQTVTEGKKAADNIEAFKSDELKQNLENAYSSGEEYIYIKDIKWGKFGMKDYTPSTKDEYEKGGGNIWKVKIVYEVEVKVEEGYTLEEAKNFVKENKRLNGMIVGGKAIPEKDETFVILRGSTPESTSSTDVIYTNPVVKADTDERKSKYGSHLAHEMGHNFGLDHANGDYTQDGLMSNKVEKIKPSDSDNNIILYKNMDSIKKK